MKRSSSSRQVKILFLAANPLDSTRLRLDEEMRTIDQTLRQTEFRDKFEIRQHGAVRVSDLQGFLLRHRPDIVHFSGHGSKTSELILEDNLGNSHPVSADAVSQLFSILKDNIRCVVLNACYSETQAQAIVRHIDCVIGMSNAILDKSAISFSASFYQALGYGKSVKTAFDLGCTQINLENLGGQDKPKLLASRIAPSKIVFVTNDDTEISEIRRIESDKHNEKGREKYRTWASKTGWDWTLLAHAIGDYIKSINYHPRNQHPWINLAYVYYVIGEKASSLEYLQESLELATPGPNHPGNHYKQVKKAINSNRSITGQRITPPSMPDWFREAYVINRISREDLKVSSHNPPNN